jgi:hypothetical protein
MRSRVSRRGPRVGAAGRYGAHHVAVQAGMRPTRLTQGTCEEPPIEAVVLEAATAGLAPVPAMEAVDALGGSELVAEAVVVFTVRAALTVPDARGSRVMRHAQDIFPGATVL